MSAVADRERKHEALASALRRAGIEARASSIERLLSDGNVEVKLPPARNGELGAAVVKVGDTRYQCRVLWAGEPDDMYCFFTSLDGVVSGTATPDQVSEYKPYGRDNGVWVTSEDIDQLGNSLGPSYETLRAETVATLIRNWARDRGVKV